jgi:hypothetical protein
MRWPRGGRRRRSPGIGVKVDTMNRPGGDPRHRSRAKTLLAGGLTLVILAGCGSTPSRPRPSDAPSPATTRGPEAISQADVQQAVDDLARLGIETHVRPSDGTPITAVTGKRSAIRLLRLQVRNLALERAGGGGTTGADLDALTASGGGGPVSALLAGWAAAGTTPGAHLAASLIRGSPSTDPLDDVFPTLALVAFVADVNGGSGGVSSGPSIRLVSTSGYCAEISAYLSDALNGIVNSPADAPPWLAQLIDLYAPQYKGNPALLQKTIGALALLSYATSLARPWTVSLVPDPASLAYGIEGEDPVGGEVDLTVLSGADVFAVDVVDCASLADAQLASVPVEGSSVVWDSSGLGVHATDVAGQSQVDDTGVAALTYQTATESRQDAENGVPVSDTMSVDAWVDRAEMSALEVVVKGILLGDAAGSPAGSTVKALYQAMEPTLNTVMRPSGFATIDVTYHTANASPSPTGNPSEGASAEPRGSGGACIETARDLAQGMPGSSETDTYPALPNNCILFLASTASATDVETYWDQRLATLGMEILGKQSLDGGGTLWLFQQQALGGRVTVYPDSPLRIEIAVCTTWIANTECRQGS